MAKDPAMLFYTSDFLTGVTLLGMKERGQYITLLCLQQQMGHMTMRQMVTAVGKLSPALLEKFVQDEEGLWYNRRADVEIEKRKAHCEKQRETIMKRWNKTSEDDTTVDDPVIPREYHGTYHGITTVIPLENENEINKPKTTVKGTLGRKEEQFNSFWEVYPKKVGKQAARRAFDKIPSSVYPKLVPAVEAQKNGYQWTKDGGAYIPNPATWLNQGRWDDEILEEPVVGNKKYMTAAEYNKYNKQTQKSVDLDGLKDFLKEFGK